MRIRSWAWGRAWAWEHHSDWWEKDSVFKKQNTLSCCHDLLCHVLLTYYLWNTLLRRCSFCSLAQGELGYWWITQDSIQLREYVCGSLGCFEHLEKGKFFVKHRTECMWHSKPCIKKIWFAKWDLEKICELAGESQLYICHQRAHFQYITQEITLLLIKNKKAFVC